MNHDKFINRVNSLVLLLVLTLCLWWLGYEIAASLKVPWTGLSRTRDQLVQTYKDLGGEK